MAELKMKSKDLYWMLLCLDFKPDDVSKSKHTILGINMFDKPNKEAFYIVIHFLFEKLDPARTKEVFRHCWPVNDRKRDAEFCKGAVTWLKEIASKVGDTFAPVAASQFRSACGLRFMNLMLCLAKYVLLQTIKTFITESSWVPEAAAVPASSREMEFKRFALVKRRFQRAMMEQDLVIQLYQKRAKDLENSLKDLNAEKAYYDALLEEHNSGSDLQEDIVTKTQKVRSLWSETDRILSTPAELQTVASVIHGQVDKYTLSGEDLSVKIPTALRERIEQGSHQWKDFKMYEEEQPVLLGLLAVFNKGLHILREEREKFKCLRVHLQSIGLEERPLLFKDGQRLGREDIGELKASIRSLQKNWESKWVHGLTSILEHDPVLDFVSPMPALSFEPALEASFETSVLSQYLCSLGDLPDPSESTAEMTRTSSCLEPEPHQEPELKIVSHPDETRSDLLATERCFSPFKTIGLQSSPLLTSIRKDHSAKTKAQIVDLECDNVTSQSSIRKAHSAKTKAQIVDLECDNLASQFAEAVITNSAKPKSDVDLGQLLNLISDPFTTGRQLCRTPESLSSYPIKDVRSSWRRAVEEGLAEKNEGSWNLCDNSPCFRNTMLEVNNSYKGSNSDVSFSCSPALALPDLQGASLNGTIPWDSLKMEALSYQNPSDLITFNISEEELPDHLENYGSFNSDCSTEGDFAHEQVEDLTRTHARSLSLIDVPLQSPQVGPKPLSEKSQNSFIMSPLHSAVFCSSEQKLFSLDLDKFESLSPPCPVENLHLPCLVELNLDEIE
ncbi:hypothetical protein DNTS_001092 [Danionella cerebrum]|uniref:HAUS augmin-like complex subunit 6 N-terminal domain-containing protein n=1 Tax=Danionella cerebrum TaxID=2873325 RepID=A0A553RFG0_9TELE|nr:hypothetical protein DNTS_001092 [Danionella translucida]